MVAGSAQWKHIRQKPALDRSTTILFSALHSANRHPPESLVFRSKNPAHNPNQKTQDSTVCHQGPSKCRHAVYARPLLSVSRFAPHAPIPGASAQLCQMHRSGSLPGLGVVGGLLALAEQKLKTGSGACCLRHRQALLAGDTRHATFRGRCWSIIRTHAWRRSVRRSRV